MMMAYAEMEVEGDEAHHMRASQTSTVWLNGGKVCLSLKTSMVRWTSPQISA